MQVVQVDERADRTDIELPVGQMLEVSLPENPTTGYRWQVAQGGEPVCSLVRDAFDPPGDRDGGQRLGRAGRHRWQLRAAHPGVGQIELVSRRPWGDQPAARRFTLTVRVPDQ